MKDHFLAYYTLFGNYSCGAHSYLRCGHWPSLDGDTRRAVLHCLAVDPQPDAPAAQSGPLGLIAALLVGTICLRLHYVGHSRHPFIWTNTLTRLDPLLMGIAIALWRRAHPPRPGWLIPMLKLALGVVAIVSISWGLASKRSRECCVAVLRHGRRFRTHPRCRAAARAQSHFVVLSRQPLVWLGKLTYGLYVYHILGLQFGGMLVGWLQGHHWVEAQAAVLVSQSWFRSHSRWPSRRFRIDSSSRSSFA